MALIGKNGMLKTWKQDGAFCAFSLPFIWSREKTCTELKTGKAARIYKIKLVIAMVYSVITVVQVALTWSNSSRQVAMHSIIFLIAFLNGIFQHSVNWRYRREAVGLFNNLLAFERQISLPENPNETKTGITSAFFVKLLINSQILTGYSMPFLYHFDMLRSPCYPMYAGYWLIDHCKGAELGTANPSHGSVSEIAVKAAVALASFLNWTFIYIGFCYFVGIELLMHGFYFTAAIEHVGGVMLGATKYSKLEDSEALNMRKLQLLLSQYRDIYSYAMLASVAVCMIVCGTACLYNSIDSVRKGISIFYGMNFLYAWCGCLLAANIMFVFGTLANVYETSKNVNEALRCKREFAKNKWFRRWLKSLPILRVYIGGTNYLEVSTPLNMENFVINQTVSLLLLN